MSSCVQQFDNNIYIGPGQPEFTPVELVGYEDIEAGSSAFQCRVVHYYNIADTREFCVVCDTENNIRHLFRVAEHAKEHENEIKQEYYTYYERRETDRFFFFVGFHNVVQFIDRLNMASYHIRETEEELEGLF